MTYIDAIKAALSPLKIPFFHDFAHKQATRYIVWSEVSASGLPADGETVNGSIMLAVDFFSKNEYEDFELIRAALERGGFSVGDIAIDFEEKTGFRHYAFTAEWSG